MSLVHFLRGAAPRPNPEAPWLLQHRHAEGGPWRFLAGASTEEGARDEAAGYGRAFDPGDLVRLLDATRLGPQKPPVHGFWVATEAGLSDAGPIEWPTMPMTSPERNARLGPAPWEAAWEARLGGVSWMMKQLRGLEPDRLALLVADCAEAFFAQVPAEETGPRRAVHAVRRWVQAGAPTPTEPATELQQEVVEAQAAAWAAYTRLARRGVNSVPAEASLAAELAASIACLGASRDAHSLAASAMDAVHRVSLSVYPPVDLATRILRFVPLSTLLLARAGERTPLDPALLLPWTP